MKPLIFYFNFYDEEVDSETTYGFIVRDPNAMYKHHNVIDCEQLIEEKIPTEELEGEYGVHDWSTHPSDEVDSIGYTTYEVDGSNQLQLMNKWRDWFTASGGNPSPIQDITTLDWMNTSASEVFSELEKLNIRNSY